MLFIQNLFIDPQYYFAVVIVVVVSIVLHELAHGWMAIYLGDDTPRETGHMTANPIVHMGMFSIVMMLLVGIAFGAMPVNPSRLRGRYGDALVALAGPAMNCLIAIVTTLILSLWLGLGGAATSHVTENLQFLLRVFGFMNIVLILFNLLPVPPLDGSHILADFVPAYRSFISTEGGRFLTLVMFLGLFMFSGRIIFPVLMLNYDKLLRILQF